MHGDINFRIIPNIVAETNQHLPRESYIEQQGRDSRSVEKKRSGYFLLIRVIVILPFSGRVIIFKSFTRRDRDEIQGGMKKTRGWKFSSTIFDEGFLERKNLK